MVFFCCSHSKNDEGDEERRSRRGIASLATINPAHVQLTQAPVPLPLPANTEDASDKWDLVAWLASVGIHRAVAGVIQQAVGPQGVDQPEAPLAFLCQLKDRATLAKLLQNGAMLEAMIDLVWKQVEALQSAGAATNSEIQSKFAGAIELSYSGLDTFFGVFSRPCPTRSRPPWPAARTAQEPCSLPTNATLTDGCLGFDSCDRRAGGCRRVAEPEAARGDDR